jgi:Na+/pantothenate symporter
LRLAAGEQARRVSMMRETKVIRAAVTIGTTFVHIVIGLLLMGFGGWVVVYQLQHPPHSDKIIIGGGVIVVLGALFMPTIFPLFRQIVVFIVPYVPLIGGKRAGDPPAEPKP